MKRSNTKKETVNKVETVNNELQLIFTQGLTEVKVNFELQAEAKDSLVIGTAINELFTLQSNYKEAGITLFKANQPTLFVVKNGEDIILNIGKCSRLIQNKLKFGNTAKSRRAFAKRVNVAVKEIRRKVEVIDYSVLTEKLNSIID